MYWISHRGCLNGKPDKENHPDQIKFCLSQGLDVEIDVWRIGDDFFLGHDTAQYPIDFEFLLQPRLWLHCKNIEALEILKDIALKVNCFYINNSDCVLTNTGHIWLSPSYKYAYPGTICVMPEDPRWEFPTSSLKNFAGICSNNIYHYKDVVNT